MIIRNTRTRVRIACFFLSLLLIQGLTPTVAWALTSGPAQPEASQFQPAGTSDMVDLFTGDFKYNIPLLDVGGYPINLNYQSGAGMDDEASWVGLGWNLNVGAMNRQIRGIADDSNGDTLRSENYMKPKITYGGSITVRGEVFGGEVFPFGFNGSLTTGLFVDNYTGWGSDITLNSGLSLSRGNASKLTPGLGISLNDNTSSGVTVTPSASLSLKKSIGDDMSAKAGLSVNCAINTREGMKDATLGASFRGAQLGRGDFQGNYGNLYSTSVSFNTAPFYPKPGVLFLSKNQTYSVDFGGAAAGVYGGGGATGYKTVREVLNRTQENRTFGHLYAEKGANVATAMMDFMREKDNPILEQTQNLPVPIVTPDIFSYTSQVGGGQIRAVRHSSGVLFDNETLDVSDNKSVSAEYGMGVYFHGGVSIYNQDVVNSNGKWKSDNRFLKKADFAAKEQVDEEEAYFQQVGEMGVRDQHFNDRILGEEAVRVSLNGKETKEELHTASGNNVIATSAFKKDGRQQRNTAVMYLNAEQVKQAGLDKQMRSYRLNRLDNNKNFKAPSCDEKRYDTIDYVGGYRKKHHIGEITVTGNDGKRMVYGIPVYNLKQEEYSFATHYENADTSNNLVQFNLNNDSSVNHRPLVKGNSVTDEYYHKETQPAYATSYLLTGILSSDYVDMTGDGITDDDRGTAFKFNYSKIDSPFHWRTPYGRVPHKAQFNKGLGADPDDDKASFISGDKELWYLNSVESKTMIAYFITEDRDDALGARWSGIQDPLKQQRLKEIRLYSKNDLKTPIKTVVFEYDYSLCNNIPNSVNGGGKLTLTKVYFKYGSSSKGSHHRYEFAYNENPPYEYLSTDKWGTYKPAHSNGTDHMEALRNDEFPYTTSDSALAAKYASAWNLSEIKLPSGGMIDIQYEADDYAYVQDKKATEMKRINFMYDNKGKVTNNLLDAVEFEVNIDDDKLTTDNLDVFKNKCLNGEDYMYFKMFVNLTDDPNSTDDQQYDFVPVYGKVSKVSVKNGTARVTLDVSWLGVVSVNPIALAAWQRMRLEYPRYAYPGYKNRFMYDSPITSILAAIVSNIGNLAELAQNFNLRAYRKKFASHVKLEKSFARIVKMNRKKLGGGARVKKIMMSDEWNAMVAGETRATYGQEYQYTTNTSSEGGQVISSGVAAYEPSSGGDENPLRQAVPYTQNVFWGLDNSYYNELPFAESLYPAPVVGYSEVKVRNLGENGVADPANKTGWLVYEFYTARDFPVYMQQTDLQMTKHKPSSWASFFGGQSIYELAMSQGYSLFLNDMHGKAKAEKVLNQTGKEISSTEYLYNAEYSGQSLRLKNVADVVDSTGTITQNQVIGREIDMITDMRQSELSNKGKSINIGLDLIPLFNIPFPIPHYPESNNDDYRLFRGAVILKTVQYYGVVSKVIKKINGSSVTASHLLYDKYTGEPVVSQSNNEFEDPVYTLSIPAYWMYSHMGMAYKTLGMTFTDFSTDQNAVPDAKFRPYLTAGDELINMQTGYRTWVVNTPGTGGNTVRLIERNGRLAKGQFGTVKVCRSGYRNLLTAPATSITSLKNPIVGDKLVMISPGDLSSNNVINASAVLYDEAWGQPAECKVKQCPLGYEEWPDGRCYLPVNATNIANYKLTDKDGDGYGKWGQNGAKFYLDKEKNWLDVGQVVWQYAHWKTRLNDIGVWLKNVPDKQWWGLEKCIDVPASGILNIGYSGDDEVKLFIDGELIEPARGENEGYFQAWFVRRMTLSPGKHTFKLIVHNFPNTEDTTTSGPKSLAFEIYDQASLSKPIYEWTENEVKNAVIMSSQSIKNDEDDISTYLFWCDADGNVIKGKGNYECPEGNKVSLCDGTPHCGVAEKQTCPDGYMPTPDGQGCIPIATGEDTSPSLTVVKGSNEAKYSELGAVFFNSIGDSGKLIAKIDSTNYWGSKNCVYQSASKASALKANTKEDMSDTASRRSAIALGLGCGKLNTVGIWLQGDFENNWIGINNCLTIQESKVYYIGMGVDNSLKLFIDGVKVKELYSKNILDDTPYQEWKVFPIYLSAGQHILTIEAMDTKYSQAVGVEVYDNTLKQLLNKKGTATIRTIFSTSQLIGKRLDTYVKDAAGNVILRRFSCSGGSVDICSGNFDCPAIPINNTLNPYLLGYLGNWLPYKQMAWLSNRSGKSILDNTSGSTGVRRNGYYEKFQAFWVYNSGWSIATNIEWVTTTTMTQYDKYSQELENKDALGRYSAARYGYKSSLPVAVGANMRHREIFYDGFEDYKFNSPCTGVLPCDPDGFNIRNILGDGYAASLDTVNTHSGNYSLVLKNDTMSLRTYVFRNEHLPGIYLSNNALGEYIHRADGWLGLRGFAPVTGNRYIFSAWVYDGNKSTAVPPLKVYLNGALLEIKVKAYVEDWKLVETEFGFESDINNLQPVTFSIGGNNLRIDDIRIFSAEGQLKTFCYDDKTQRLMAEMDENNYATFYEYDDEGTLVRVKKETERGIMTIKETRSSYRNGDK